MSDDQRSTKWMIRVDGSDLASVEAGQTVEIGRKPLRPLSDDGVQRIEIVDNTRSMSKRHAQFSVKSDGNAILRDLNSTNGTYVVHPGNELMRLANGADFAMTDDTVRLQFGDVPVDFVRYIDDDTSVNTDDQQDIPNLFDYAVDNSPAEPEASEMSVDDILDLRAGEPTNIFDAQRVRTRAQQLHAAEQQTFVPFVQPINPVTLQDGAAQEEREVAPRDLFADAHDVASGKIEEPAVRQEEFTPRKSGPRHASNRTGDRLIEVDELSKPRNDVNLTVQTGEEIPVQTPRHASVPVTQASSVVVPEEAPVTEVPQTESAPASEHEQFAQQHADLHLDVIATTISTDGQQAAAQEPVQQEPESTQTVVTDAASSVNTTQDNAQQESTQQPAEQTDAQSVQSQQDYARFQPPAQSEPAVELEATQAFTPVFEPGSVFERVANGDFDQREDIIEVGGFTSDQARRTDDFTEQFNMARHIELLPFLAMNPSLYDDLYAWLAAQGNADVDAALARNPGYEDYRKTVGR